MTALSVDEALGQLGYRADDLVLSASRSERLPLRGMELTITTPKEIVLVADGQERVVTHDRRYRRRAARRAGHHADAPTDKTSLYPDQALLNQMRLQVFRVQVTEVAEATASPPRQVETPDPDAFVGERTVTKPGAVGEQATKYRVTVVDGVETGREVLEQRRHRPARHRAGTVGTKPRPTARADRRRPQLGRAGEVRVRRTTRARSTPAATTRPVPVLPETWRSVGGTGNPIDASPAEQTARAQILYNKAGAGQWGCGSHLFD